MRQSRWWTCLQTQLVPRSLDALAAAALSAVMVTDSKQSLLQELVDANMFLPSLAAADVPAVTDEKQLRLQELVDASELLVDMPSLANPAWLSAGEDRD